MQKPADSNEKLRIPAIFKYSETAEDPPSKLRLGGDFGAILSPYMSGQPSKTFYLETFGCQMNAHDSEKVVGTLLSQGYRQAETVEEAGLVLYNTCSIRDKAEQIGRAHV